ncbi:MAG: outer membrane protein assembly factor BamB [Limisphaerales bacterium]|jgi:outer membrane protein assembly factor BamB
MANRFLLSLFASAFLSLSLHASQPPAKHWPRWRGPDDSGSTAHGSYPARFSDTENVLWKYALPAKGCSTPIVWGDNIIVSSPDDGADTVFNFNWDGVVKWRAAVGDERPGRHKNGSGSNPSPATDGQGVYVYFKSGNLAGLNFDGKVKWKTNLQKRFGKDTLYWDIGTSPVLTENHIIVAVMHDREGFLAAFDKQTGNLSWKADRNFKTPREGDHSYATPIVREQNGKQQIVVWGAEHLTTHDASDGKEIWRCGGFNPEQKNNWVIVGSHVIHDDTAIVSYGRGSHMAAIRLTGKGNVTATHKIWDRQGAGSFVPSLAVYRDKIFVIGDKGAVHCIDPKTGKDLWKAELPKHRSKYYASPTLADGKLYATREDGVIFVASVDKRFELLSENNLGERVIASPVPVGNRLLLRGEKHLFCVGVN